MELYENALPSVAEAITLKSVKNNQYDQVPLLEMYYYTTKCSHMSDEKLKEYFCSVLIPYIHTFPQVSTTLKYKGNLRISWAFDMKYHKNIDLIFFPEDNPYINYVTLYAKDFPKSIDTNDGYSTDRVLATLKIPYNINYDFVKEILLQASIHQGSNPSQYDKSLQESFFKVRFGSVFVPMEIEFEWYIVPWQVAWYPVLGKTYIHDIITFPNYDGYLNGILDTPDSLGLCLGIIKSSKLLAQDTTLNFPPYIASWSDSEYNEQSGLNEETTKHISYSRVFAPLGTSVLAITQANINDYLVNVRDKPDSKEGKIIAQLLADSIKPPKDFYIEAHHGELDYAYSPEEADDSNVVINPKYNKAIELGNTLYRKDNQDSTDWEGCFLYHHEKAKQTYFAKEKSKLINPLDSNTYLILVWNITSNDWAKVWVLRVAQDTDWAMIGGKKVFFKDRKSLSEYETKLFYTNGSYKQTFLESPSRLRLYDGYIHTSALKYMCPFGEDYIRK